MLKIKEIANLDPIKFHGLDLIGRDQESGDPVFVGPSGFPRTLRQIDRSYWDAGEESPFTDADRATVEEILAEYHV